MKRKCIDCGKEFETTAKQRMCDDCWECFQLKTRESRKERQKKSRRVANKPAVIPKSAIIDGQSCSLCADIHRAIQLGISYGQYMGHKAHYEGYE